MTYPNSYPGQTMPAQNYVPQQAVRQPAARSPNQGVDAPRSPVMTRGGSSIYLPPVKEVLGAPKPPPFGRPEVAAQEKPRSSIARGQTPGEEQPIAPPHHLQAKVELPSREELGLLTANRAAVEPNLDWNAARVQLDRWQATNYRLEKTADGQFRFLCTLPYTQTPGKARQFEATASTEGEALRLALDQAQTWQRTQRQ